VKPSAELWLGVAWAALVQARAASSAVMRSKIWQVGVDIASPRVGWEPASGRALALMLERIDALSIERWQRMVGMIRSGKSRGAVKSWNLEPERLTIQGRRRPDGIAIE
jgi:hypothetical protein